jgi:hypothetical protein
MALFDDLVKSIGIKIFSITGSFIVQRFSKPNRLQFLILFPGTGSLCKQLVTIYIDTQN